MTRQCTRLRVSTQGSVVLLLRGEGGPSGLAVGCRVWSHLGPGCSGSIGRVCRAGQAWAPGDGGLTPPRGQLGSVTIRFPPSAWTEDLLESSFLNQPLCVGSECPLFSRSWVGGLGALCSGAGLLGLAHGEGSVLGWPHWVGRSAGRAGLALTVAAPCKAGTNLEKERAGPRPTRLLRPGPKSVLKILDLNAKWHCCYLNGSFWSSRPCSP